jgi:hypothetical protein
MARLTILGGDPGGRACFVGLLYSALVRRASEPASPLRFHVDPQSVETFGRLFEALRAGEYPAPLPTMPALALQVSAPTPERPHHLANAFHRALPRGQETRWEIGCLNESDLDSFLSAKGAMTAGSSALFASTSLVILLPPPSASPSPPGDARILDDERLGELLAQMARTIRDHPELRGSPISPLVVWDRWDQATPAARSLVQLPTNPGALDPEVRRRIGEHLADLGLPKASAGFQAVRDAGARVAPPVPFVTWVAPTPTGVEVVASTERGLEPAYPYREFLALWEHILADGSSRG